MMICYVAGKYTAPTREGVQANIDAAECAGKYILQQGYTPIIPHRITAFWDEDPQFAHMGHKDWMDKVCLPLLDRCDAVIMCEGWESSPGSCIEYEHAKKTRKAIFYHHAV